MANGDTETHRHFILEGFTDTETYRAPRGGGGGTTVPPRDRTEHAATLSAQLTDVRAAAEGAARDAEDPEDGLGIQVEFQSFPDIDLAFESLSRENQGIELRNVRHRGDTTYATVFVPTGKLEHFEKLIRNYLDYRQDSLGRPLDNRRLLDAIQAIRAASVRALWTDDDEVFPETATERFWWEIWIPIGRDRETGIAAFRERAASLGMRVSPGELRFPERSVLVARTSLAAIQQSIATLNSIAELRRAKETADFFDSLMLPEQSEWLDDLLDRTTFNGGPDAPHVCLLDTGVNRAHPLIAPVLDASDLHTVEPAWGARDDAGHGTEMAGLAIAGNLTDVLDRADDIEIEHRLESVKLLQDDGANGTDSRHHGDLTAEAVSRPEVYAPARHRVFVYLNAGCDCVALGRGDQRHGGFGEMARNDCKDCGVERGVVVPDEQCILAAPPTELRYSVRMPDAEPVVLGVQALENVPCRGDAAHAAIARIMNEPGTPHVVGFDSDDLARDPRDVFRPITHVGLGTA